MRDISAHLPTNQYLLNVHALHNYQYVKLAVPSALQTGRPFFNPDMDNLRRMAAAQVRKSKRTSNKTGEQDEADGEEDFDAFTLLPALQQTSKTRTKKPPRAVPSARRPRVAVPTYARDNSALPNPDSNKSRPVHVNERQNPSPHREKAIDERLYADLPTPKVVGSNWHSNAASYHPQPACSARTLPPSPSPHDYRMASPLIPSHPLMHEQLGHRGLSGSSRIVQATYPTNHPLAHKQLRHQGLASQQVPSMSLVTGMLPPPFVPTSVPYSTAQNDAPLRHSGTVCAAFSHHPQPVCAVRTPIQPLQRGYPIADQPTRLPAHEEPGHRGLQSLPIRSPFVPTSVPFSMTWNDTALRNSGVGARALISHQPRPVGSVQNMTPSFPQQGGPISYPSIHPLATSPSPYHYEQLGHRGLPTQHAQTAMPSPAFTPLQPTSLATQWLLQPLQNQAPVQNAWSLPEPWTPSG